MIKSAKKLCKSLFTQKKPQQNAILCDNALFAVKDHKALMLLSNCTTTFKNIKLLHHFPIFSTPCLQLFFKKKIVGKVIEKIN